MADDVTRTAIGIVMALQREDPGGLAALFYGGGGPVDERELMVTLARLCARLAEEGRRQSQDSDDR